MHVGLEEGQAAYITSVLGGPLRAQGIFKCKVVHEVCTALTLEIIALKP